MCDTKLYDRFGLIVGATIGEGTFAKIKLAFDTILNKNVALKIIQEKKTSQLFWKKFLPREIEIIQTLCHSNILHYFDCIHTTHRIIIVMEYAENGDFLDLLNKQKGFSENNAQYYFKQLLSAIEYCHCHGIAHRDLKLENLLLDKHNNLKLSDFGFARFYDMTFELSSTFCGSLAYASPEILSKSPYNPFASDVWAVGVILYAFVYGRLPFDDSSPVRLRNSIKNGPKILSDVIVSDDYINLLKAIFTSASERIKISQIKHFAWLTTKANSRKKKIDFDACSRK